MRILFFGDSNTWGYTPSGDRYPADIRWPSRISKISDPGRFSVYTDGLNGREIPLHTDSVRKEITADQIDLFAVMLGSNDLLDMDMPDAVKVQARMRRFLKPLLPYADILLISPVHMNVSHLGGFMPDERVSAESKKLSRLYQELADEMHIRDVNADAWDIPLSWDGVHFTGEGHVRFSEHMAEYLAQLIRNK